MALTPTPSLTAPLLCRNCGAPLYGKYCYECGQPVTDLVRHFGSVLGDVMDSVLSIDGRIVHTLVPLYFRPGKLTLDYLDGKRVRYVKPFRLVFFLAIMAFFAIQLTLHTNSIHFVHLETPPVAGVSISTAPLADARAQDTHFANGDITFNNEVLWNRHSRPLHLGWLPDFAGNWLNDSIENARANLHDMNSNNTAEEMVTARRLMGGVFAVAPQVLFLLLPVFALLLKLFYTSQHRLYMEHLIVAMHSHAFIMLSLLVVMTLDLFRNWVAPHVVLLDSLLGLLHDAAWIWIPAYLFIMQKRIYQQGRFKTTVKYGCIGLCYSMLVAMGIAFALLVSLGST